MSRLCAYVSDCLHGTFQDMMNVPHNRSNYWRLICIVTVTSCLVFPVRGQGFHASQSRYAGGNRSEKPGFCPAVILMTSQKCPDACGGDNDCWGMKKCCRNGCGKRCTEPEVRNSVSTATFGQHNTHHIQGGGSNTAGSQKAPPSGGAYNQHFSQSFGYQNRNPGNIPGNSNTNQGQQQNTPAGQTQSHSNSPTGGATNSQSNPNQNSNHIPGSGRQPPNLQSRTSAGSVNSPSSGSNGFPSNSAGSLNTQQGNQTNRSNIPPPGSMRVQTHNTNHIGGSNNPTVPSSSLNSGVEPTPGTLHGTQTQYGGPMGGAQTPMGGAQTPMGGAQTPMGGAQTPIGGAQTPMGGAQTPIGGAQTPMGGAQTPVGGAQTQYGSPMGVAQTQQSGLYNPPSYVNADPTGNTQYEPSHNTQQQFYFPVAGPENPPPPQHASSSSQHGLPNSQHNAPPSQNGLHNSQNSAPSSQHNAPAGQHGLPNSQHNVPPNQQGLPPSQHNAPAGQHNAPAGQHGLPISQHNVPPNQHNVPPSQHNAPAGQHNAPAGQHGLPNSQHNVPPNQQGLPPSQHNAPAGQHNAPAGQHNAPAGQHNVPAGQHGLPISQHNFPPNQHNVPPSQHNAPAGQHNAPAGQHGLPNSQHNVPPNQQGLPPSQHNAPAGQHNAPAGQHRLPTSQHNVPPSQHNVPPNEQGLPPSQHNAPAGQYGLPPSQHNAPPSQHGLPNSHQEVPNSQHGTPTNQHSVPYSQQDVPYSPPRAANNHHVNLPSGPYNSYPDIQSGYNQHDTPMLDSNSNYANPTGGQYNSQSNPAGGQYNSAPIPAGGQYNSPSNPAGGQYNSPSNPAGGQYNSAPNPAQTNYNPPPQTTGGYSQFNNPQEAVGVLNNQTYNQAFEPIQNNRVNAGSQQEYGPPLTSQGPPIPFSGSSRGGSEYHNIPRSVPRDTSNSRQGNIQPGVPNTQSSHSIGGSNQNNPLRGYKNQADPAGTHSHTEVGGSNTQYEHSGGSNSRFSNTPQPVGGLNSRGLNLRPTRGGSGVGNLHTIPLYQTTPIYDVRDGVCPRVFSRGVCQDECQSDSQCPGYRKCCSNGCGRVCLEPQNKDANADPIVPKTIQKPSKHGSHGPSDAVFDGEANNLVDPSSLNILEIRPYSVGQSHSAVQILPYEYKTGRYDYHLENTVLNEIVGETHHASDPYSYKQEPANAEPENKITQVVNPVIGRNINSKLHAKSMFSGSAVKLRPSMFGSVKIVPLDMKKFRKPKSGVNKKSMGVAELENPHNVKPHTEIPVVKANRPNANKFVPGIPSETSLVEREPEIYSQTSNHNNPHEVNTVQQTQGKRNIRIDHGGTHISPSTGQDLQGSRSRRGPHSSAGRSPATMYKSALKEGQGPQSRVRKPNNVHGRHNQNHAPETVPQENKGREPQRSQPSSASVGNQRPGGKGSLKPSRLVEGAQRRQQEAGSPRESRTSVNFGNLRSSARYGVESSPPRHGKQMNVMQFSAQGKTSAGPLAPVTVAVTRAPIIDPAVHNKGEANPKLLNKNSETKITVKTRKKSDMNVHPINSINYKNNGYSKNFFNPVYDQPAPQEIDPPTHFGDGMIRAMPRRGNSFSLMGGGKEAGTSMYDGSTSLQYNAANLGISDYGHPQTSAFEAQPIRRQRMRQRPARTGLSISKIYHDVGHGRAIMEPPNPYEFSSEFRRPSTKRPKPTYRPPVDSLGQVYIDIARFAENSLMAAPNPLKLRSGVRGHIPDIKTTAPPTSFSTPKETPISFIEKKTTDTINKNEVPKPDVKKKDARPKQYIPAGMALAKGSSDYPTNLKTKSSQSAPRLGISSTLVGAPAPAMKVETKIFNRAGFNLFTGYKPQYKVPVKEIRNPSIKGVPVFSARTKTTG